MKSIFLIIAAVLTCGFIVQTPESRKELEQTRQRWHREVESRYEKRALHAFLRNSITDIPEIAGASLVNIAVGAKFRPAKDRFYWKADQWFFVTKQPKQEMFELRGYLGADGWVVLQCKRESRKRFTVVEYRIDPLIVLSPPAYTFGPGQ